MWINVSSMLWMLLCATVLIGASMAVSPYVVVAVVLTPFVVGGLNSAGGSLASWASFAVSAVPYVLVFAVHSVLVFLFAMATLDRFVHGEEGGRGGGGGSHVLYAFAEIPLTTHPRRDGLGLRRRRGGGGLQPRAFFFMFGLSVRQMAFVVHTTIHPIIHALLS